MSSTRLESFRQALASDDPLAAVRLLVPDDGENEQQVVVYAYACILETNSAGLSILFDRYDDDALVKIDAALESIGALRTRADLHEMMKALHHALDSGRDRLDASESLQLQPSIKELDTKYRAHVEEMERKLLAFCQRHVNELASR